MNRHLRRALMLILSLQLVSTSYSQATANLSRQGWYADPEIHIFGGRYWIYPTSSSPESDSQDKSFNPPQQKLRAGHVIHPVYLLHTSLDALSSPDLVHWTKHKDVMDVKDVSWAAYAIWALPQSS
ncbi:hypothetical protein [Edaphobacter sp. HDX4]|uniref:hypothetical protein n=1 Tax=Edaphobacter sp. HDX4 TaxID=2794064 RepID=UPI002FE616FE